MRILDAHFEHGGQFVTGEFFTLADVVLGLSTHRWLLSPIERPHLDAVHGYYQRLSVRPAFRAHVDARTFHDGRRAARHRRAHLLPCSASLHAVYTLLDERNPRRLAPDDPAVVTAMQASKMRLSRGATTMWQAWISFNLTHSLAALMFGAACFIVAACFRIFAFPPVALFALAGVSLLITAHRPALLVRHPPRRQRHRHRLPAGRGLALTVLTPLRKVLISNT